MSQICKNFNTSTNNIQTRVTRIFSSALNNEKSPFSSLYGSIGGLSELGTEVVKVLVMPKVIMVSNRLDQAVAEEGELIPPGLAKIASVHITHLLVVSTYFVLTLMWLFYTATHITMGIIIITFLSYVTSG